MIRLNEHIWIGDSADERYTDIDTECIGAILNVAQDLQARGHRRGVEYMQVGIIDGPGNPPAAYHAAVLALVTLLKRHEQVLVCCHTGGRSLAVAILHMGMTTGHDWDGLLGILRERVDAVLPVPHAAHRAAFSKMNWRLLNSVMGD